MQIDHGLSARRADRTLGLSRSARHYAPRPRDDSALIEAIERHLKDNPGYGFGLLFEEALQPKGFGKTRSWRVYVAMKLNRPRRGKRRLPDRIREPLAIPEQANHTWSADFMADALWSGHRFRTFNVNDDFNRESLRIEIDTSLPSLRVIRALDELVELRGAPQRLRLDNGPEFISAALRGNGPSGMASSCCTSSPASRPRTPTSNASTAPSAPRSWIVTSSPACTKCAAWPRTGATVTTTNDPIARSAGSRPSLTPWHHPLPLLPGDSEKRGRFS